jgi:hypothetical protein
MCCQHNTMGKGSLGCCRLSKSLRRQCPHPMPLVLHMGGYLLQDAPLPPLFQLSIVG